MRNEKLSARRPCALLGLAGSGVYRLPKPARADDAAVMRRIDALNTDHPFYGSRWIACELKMSRKRVQRLMRLMGIAAVGPKPHTSTPRAGAQGGRHARAERSG
jgi:putative transposase